MFQDALVYAKVHYEQDEHHLVFTDHVEELQMLQERHSFQLEDIMQLRELMQAIIQEECRKLEDMILHLQNLVEGVDTTKATSEEADFVALTKSFATTNMLHHAVPRQPAVASSSGVSSPKKSKHPLLPRNDIPTSKSIPKKLDLKFEDSVIVSNDSMDGMSKYLSEGVEGDGDRRPSRNNNNHASPSSPKAAHPRKGSTSRFRERLQDAQSELFLVDEF